MKELISVIVPVYNVQKYLEKCIESILSQTYKNIEIILIDDGSTDNSGKICDECVERDSRIRVIHQKNKGLSAARNRGIECSKGKYIVFIDSDDYIHNRMIEILYQAIIENHAELAICDFKYVYEYNKDEKEIVSPIQNEVLNNNEVIEKLFEKNAWYYIVAWNKLYKKELWDNIRFPVGYIHEDEAVIHHILIKCKKVVTVKQKLYYYRQIINSITHTKNAKRTDWYFALADRLVFLERKVSEKNIKILAYQFWNPYLEDFFKYFNDKKNALYTKRMKKSLGRVLPVMVRIGYFTIKDALSIVIFLVNPKIYKKFFMK